jgi:hypothetical protein
MWLISFVWGLLPDGLLLWFINTLFVTGLVLTIVGFFLKAVPFVLQYRLIIQVLGVIFLTMGVYFKGSYSTEIVWREKVRIAEEKVRIAEEEAKKANEEIKTKVVTKVKVVRDTKVVIKEVIKEVEKEIDSKCTITPATVNILNNAAKSIKPEPAK